MRSANDHHAGTGEGLAVGQQAMDAGDADVVVMLDIVAHDFGGDDNLFGDWDVTGAGRNYGDDALAVFRGITLQNDGAARL